jgi:hypothetical protein
MWAVGGQLSVQVEPSLAVTSIVRENRPLRATIDALT